MHSSRMRTVRLLTVYQHALLGGVPAQGGVPAGQRVYLPPPPCEQNDRQVHKYYLAANFVCRR